MTTVTAHTEGYHLFVKSHDLLLLVTTEVNSVLFKKRKRSRVSVANIIQFKSKTMNTSTPVSEIMTTSLTTVPPNMTLDKVKHLFETHDFHHIPVVENGSLRGILSKLDIYRVAHCIDLFHSKSNAEYNDRLFKSLLAEEVMASNATVIAPDDTVGYAATLFNKNEFHALPVVVGEKLVGMVTTYDLIQYAYESHVHA